MLPVCVFRRFFVSFPTVVLNFTVLKPILDKSTWMFVLGVGFAIWAGLKLNPLLTLVFFLVCMPSPCPLRCAQILDALQKDYRQAKLMRHGGTFSLFAAGGGLSAGGVFLGAPPEMGAGAAAITLVAVGGLQVNTNNMPMVLRVWRERMWCW